MTLGPMGSLELVCVALGELASLLMKLIVAAGLNPTEIKWNECLDICGIKTVEAMFVKGKFKGVRHNPYGH
jgi:hypothetical protein